MSPQLLDRYLTSITRKFPNVPYEQLPKKTQRVVKQAIDNKIKPVADFDFNSINTSS